jgi:hypothetical protein
VAWEHKGPAAPDSPLFKEGYTIAFGTTRPNLPSDEKATKKPARKRKKRRSSAGRRSSPAHVHK